MISSRRLSTGPVSHSCKTSESSYSSDALKHGVWTYQVIQALEGNARAASRRGQVCNSLFPSELSRSGNPENSAESIQQASVANTLAVWQSKARTSLSLTLMMS